jgi:hypothetical protein
MANQKALRVLETLQQFITEYAQQPVRLHTSQYECDMMSQLVNTTHIILQATLTKQGTLQEEYTTKLKLKKEFILLATKYHFGVARARRSKKRTNGPLHFPPAY